MTLYEEARTAAKELIEKAKLVQGMIVVVGCSSSEILGEEIGKRSSLEAAQEVFRGLYDVLRDCGVYIAAQCCEHLNRAIVVEREACPTAEYVNVVPQPKAGGSFATVAYHSFKQPIVLEHIRADAGIDIGNTLIGMHLKEVAVPLRLSVRSIGSAYVNAARVRPKFIGGVRAAYDEALL